MSDPDNARPHADEEKTVIRPATYQPRQEADEGGFRPTRNQIITISVVVPVLLAVWFLFTAKSVRLEFEPPVESMEISGGVSFELGGIYLLRQGSYELEAQTAGYHPLVTSLNVGTERNQTHRFELIRLPGRVSFLSDPPGATFRVDDVELGQTPAGPLDIEAGNRTITYTRERYQTLELLTEVVGMQTEQTVSDTLLPDWAEVSITTVPARAEIFIDEVSTGMFSPATVEVLSGEREIRLRIAGHKSHRQRILVAALEQVDLPEITLQQADGLLNVTSSPRGAGVTLDGQFQGETPIELAVKSRTKYRLQVFKAGYKPVERSIQLKVEEDRQVHLNLSRQTGQVVVVVDPPEAQLLIDGKSKGRANQTMTLPTFAHQLEVRLDGYASYATEITPRTGLTQEVKIRLLTIEEARLAALKPLIRTHLDQELILFKPDTFSMGASRRQPGRRANETLHEVQMRRLFYLGTHEVTNLQFQAFARGHNSGTFEEHDLNKDDQPAVGVSWEEAALYCNWLSDAEGLPHFYVTEFGKVVAMNAQATGFRLPTEAEWAWAARQVDAEAPLRFGWGGNLPPPDRHGNYADRSAAHLVGRIIFGYNDNYIVAAPAGTYESSKVGLFDMSGNVSEWINDFYEIPAAETVSDPLGPEKGEYRVIRGSSWMHGTITDLRISFRDYGLEGRQDVGFRIARFAEDK